MLCYGISNFWSLRAIFIKCHIRFYMKYVWQYFLKASVLLKVEL